MVRIMVWVQNDPIELLLTVQLTSLKTFLSTKTVLYGPIYTKQRGEQPSAARPALLLYVCKNQDVFKYEK